MAMVQVDLSEYDMLRQAKQKAEDECAELKENIKALKNSSKAIVRTVHIKNRVKFDIDKIIQTLSKNIRIITEHCLTVLLVTISLMTWYCKKVFVQHYILQEHFLSKKM
jgi:hypothetical protein